MRRIRFAWTFLFTFIKRFRGLLTIGVLVGIVLFLLLKIVVPRLFFKDVEYIGIVGRYHIDELPEGVLSGVSEGLTQIDENGLPIASLAKDWEATDSGKTWIFHLDTSKKWQDGTPVTADTIQYSFSEVTIDRPSHDTIVFSLQNAYAPFASVVSRPTFKKGLLGTGEWRVSNLSVSSTYIEKLDLVNDKTGKSRVLRFYPSEESAKIAFKLGKIDKLEEVHDTEDFSGWNTVSIDSEVDKKGFVGVFFNIRNAPFKDNKVLRQSLAYAINKEDWGEDLRTISPVPQDSWAYNPQVKTYEYDIEHARELLKGVLNKENSLSLTLSTNEENRPVAEKIAKDWGEIGISTQVQVVNSLPEDYQVFLGRYEVSLDPDQYLTWHSTQETTNITHFSNPRIDKLLEDGRLEMDTEKRKKIYLDFQRFLMEDVPVVVLYHPTVHSVTRK